MADDPIFPLTGPGGATTAKPETNEQTGGAHSGAQRQVISAVPLHTAQATATWNSSTADEATLALDCAAGHARNGYGAAILTLLANGGTCTAGHVVFEASFDGGSTYKEIIGILEVDGFNTCYQTSEADLTGYAGFSGSLTIRFNLLGVTNVRLRLDTAITGSLSLALGLSASTLPGPIIDGSLNSLSGVGSEATVARSVQGSSSMVPLKVTSAASSQADGHSATLGATGDADTALTVIGRLKKLIALLPTALGAGGGLKVDGSGATQPVSAAALPLPTGAATEATLADIDSLIDGVTAGAGTAVANTIQVQGHASGVPLPVTGGVAHDASDSGNPMKIGGKARQTNPTAVADGDRVDASFDDEGRQVTVAGQVRDLITDATTTITNSTSETTILAAAASTFHDLTLLVLTNSGGAQTVVSIRDDTGGSVRMSVCVVAGGSAVIPFPRPFKQGTVNKNWTAQCSVATTSLFVTVQAEKNI